MTRALLCYITDRSVFTGDELERRRRLLSKIAEAARAGVDYIQLREKDLSTQELESLAREAISVLTGLKAAKPELRASLLINSRTDIALAVRAEGVHLPSDDVAVEEVRSIWSGASGACEKSPGDPVIGVSCHSREDVARAYAHGAGFAVFAPVFEKKDAPGVHPTGLAQLREACRGKIPVFALGGVTLENARSCLDAGAAGIAGIRLFQENSIEGVVKWLR